MDFVIPLFSAVSHSLSYLIMSALLYFFSIIAGKKAGYKVPHSEPQRLKKLSSGICSMMSEISHSRRLQRRSTLQVVTPSLLRNLESCALLIWYFSWRALFEIPFALAVSHNLSNFIIIRRTLPLDFLSLLQYYLVVGRLHIRNPNEPPRSKLRGIQPWLPSSERCKQRGIRPVKE